jgi:hypothetical protein
MKTNEAANETAEVEAGQKWGFDNYALLVGLPILSA